MRLRFLPVLAVAGLLGPAVVPAPAPAASVSCPHHTGEIVNVGHGFGRAWHNGTSLWACTTVYGHRPRGKRMGPWTKGTRVAYDGASIAWTVRTTVGGVPSDRIWAGNVDAGDRWMLAQKPNPGGADPAAREGLVQRVLVADQAIMWVTRAGDVVGAVRSPTGATPTPVGSPSAPPTVLQDRLLLLGTYTAVPPATLAASARLVEQAGEGDACGGGNPYRFTFTPVAGAPATGATWDSYWTSTDTAACG